MAPETAALPDVPDDLLILAVESAALGFPLDAWLAIQNSAGKELVKNDDGTTADPLLEWTVPETDSYVAVIGSVLHRAGPDHRYRLSVQSALPAFQGVIAESGFTVEPGKSIKVKVTARRLQGFGGIGPPAGRDDRQRVTAARERLRQFGTGAPGTAADGRILVIKKQNAHAWRKPPSTSAG